MSHLNWASKIPSIFEGLLNQSMEFLTKTSLKWDKKRNKLTRSNETTWHSNGYKAGCEIFPGFKSATPFLLNGTRNHHHFRNRNWASQPVSTNKCGRAITNYLRIKAHMVQQERGGCPEIKVLKQSIRDCIAPQKDLGHSVPSKASNGDLIYLPEIPSRKLCILLHESNSSRAARQVSGKAIPVFSAKKRIYLATPWE